jgi:hypothetical protein
METAKNTEAVVVQENAPAVQDKAVASVETWITTAIESNMPVETLERLFGLRKEYKAEIAREAFTEAMAQFQSKCPVIEKKKIVKDKFGKERYKYAPIDQIDEQTREARTGAGLSFATDVVNEDGYITAVVKVTHVLGHSETSSFRVPIDKDAFMSAPQKVAAAMTFAKRYAFCNAFGILTGDEDTDAVEEEPVARTAPRVASPAPAPRPAVKKPAVPAKPIDPVKLEYYRSVMNQSENETSRTTFWFSIVICLHSRLI